MNWLSLLLTELSKLPIERVLFPEPDRVAAFKALEAEFKRICGEASISEAEVRNRVRAIYQQVGELKGLVEKGLVSEDLLVKIVEEEKLK